jgi:hypothetical protein
MERPMPHFRQWFPMIVLSGVSCLSALSAVFLVATDPAGSALPVVAGNARAPAVVELFQSQGCSSCPPAAAVINALADRPDVLALSFAVTYWDQLGWKDRFASPAFTARQWDYAHAGRRANVYTPQVVVNGRAALVGNVRREVEQAIARTVRPLDEPVIAKQGVTVSVGASKGGRRSSATVWLVRFDPRTIQVPIAAGENAGRTLPHRNVVRDLVALGDWTGTAATYRLPPATKGLASAILVQSGKGGRIVAAARI